MRVRYTAEDLRRLRREAMDEVELEAELGLAP